MVSKLEFTGYEISSADLGAENYMPDIKNVDYIHAGYTVTSRVREEDAKQIGRGMIHTLLPYTLQDNYGRGRKTRVFQAAILENDKLKAVFLPELGGRLWSLYHKGLDRELLYVNRIFQPANLALRNAWFSGGVEWNVGIKGHNPLTCSPLYACRMEDADGNPVLRMYEYERIRGVAYSVDFLLPDDSDVLYVKAVIENTSEEDKYMYWWSNMAVPETETTRVIAPCGEALQTHYGEDGYVIDMVDIPFPGEDGVDCTYPQNAACSRDYFFRIGKEQRKWVAAVEKDGIGLLEFSTPEMIGRKLFLWGQGQGGRNWNRWLADDSAPYVEIQAGLARTQYEHIVMKAKSAISWVEGYTAAVCEPERVHGEYQAAVRTVEAYLDGIMPSEKEMRSKFEHLKMLKTEQYGSGWGHVENVLRERSGREAVSRRLEFPMEAVGRGEKIWLDFLETGYLEEESLKFPPVSFYVDREILKFFERQIKDNRENAYMYLQYGIALYANEMVREAHRAFEKSGELEPNAWAYRNLSMIEKNEYGNPGNALAYMEEAIALNNTYRGLMVNCAQVMLGAGAWARWLEIFENLDERLKEDGRLRLYKAIALIETEEYEKAAEIINPDFVLCDIKEGEVSISHIWTQLYRELVKKETGITEEREWKALQESRYPLPAHLDFRMDR